MQDPTHLQAPSTGKKEVKKREKRVDVNSLTLEEKLL
jgi:hypothetical protein